MQRDVMFREATAADRPVTGQLLTHAGLPLHGVQAHLPGFVLAFPGEQGTGVAGIEPHGPHGPPRSRTVRVDQQGKGVGQALTSEMIRWAREADLESLTQLTTTADGFFPKSGFSRLTRDDRPPCVFASPGLQGVCPASAAVMPLRLKAGMLP